MVTSPDNNIKNENGLIVAYEDRPISMYDNLNNMTANTLNVTPTNSNNSRMTNATISLNPNSVQTTTSPHTSSKANGAAHSTPFTDINFVLNENNKPQQAQQQEQQLQTNGNRNLNEIEPNTGNAAVFATPYKTSALKLATTTASLPLATQQNNQQHSPLILPATTTTKTSIETKTLTSSSPPLLHSNAAIGTTTSTATATANSETFNSFNRPLSQHSESALSDTSHSIAAVKAALNEAKSKFFGLNGYTPTQQQIHYDDSSYIEESLKHQLIPSDIQPNIHQIQIQQQQVQKPQPKYQNIPENSAIFRKQIVDGAGSPPDLPPKPIQYQNAQQQPSMRSNNTSTPDQIRHMPVTSNTYNQISLSDIDGATSRSQVRNKTVKTVAFEKKETNYFCPFHLKFKRDHNRLLFNILITIMGQMLHIITQLKTHLIF